MTEDEMREVLGLGPEWEVVWMEVDPQDPVPHLCVGPSGPDGTHGSRWIGLPYMPTPAPGIEAAKCARCRVAWVRAVGG